VQPGGEHRRGWAFHRTIRRTLDRFIVLNPADHPETNRLRQAKKPSELARERRRPAGWLRRWISRSHPCSERHSALSRSGCALVNSAKIGNFSAPIQGERHRTGSVDTRNRVMVGT